MSCWPRNQKVKSRGYRIHRRQVVCREEIRYIIDWKQYPGLLPPSHLRFSSPRPHIHIVTIQTNINGNLGVLTTLLWLEWLCTFPNFNAHLTEIYIVYHILLEALHIRSSTPIDNRRHSVVLAYLWGQHRRTRLTRTILEAAKRFLEIIRWLLVARFAESPWWLTWQFQHDLNLCFARFGDLRGLKGVSCLFVRCHVRKRWRSS